MLTLEVIKEKLSDRKLSVVSEKSGVNYLALCNLYNGKSNPTYETVKKLSDYLERE